MGIDCILASLQSFLAHIGLQQHSHTASLWLFFAACGVTELCISFLICTPLERFWPLTSWPKRNPIAADVTYAFFVRIILFPLIAYFEYNWLHTTLRRILLSHGTTPLSLPALFPFLTSVPVVIFILNFAILDLSDYWRHRFSHRYGWWYGIHSLHHAEDQLTFWSDDRSHILEDAITYLWLITVGLTIDVPSLQFPSSSSASAFSAACLTPTLALATAGSATTSSSRLASTEPTTPSAPPDAATATTARPCPSGTPSSAPQNSTTILSEPGDSGPSRPWSPAVGASSRPRVSAV